MENKDLSKMSLEDLIDYSLDLDKEFEELQRKLRWAKDFKFYYIDSPEKTTKDKLMYISGVINERYAKYQMMDCSKKLNKLEKQIDELETFLDSR
jgi:hypothetical protein